LSSWKNGFLNFISQGGTENVRERRTQERGDAAASRIDLVQGIFPRIFSVLPGNRFTLCSFAFKPRRGGEGGMRGNKENQEISVIGRLVSLEALVVLMGVVSLIYGLVALRLPNIIIGALILVAAFLLGCKCRQIRHR
jgi:hypothetical protein